MITKGMKGKGILAQRISDSKMDPQVLLLITGKTIKVPLEVLKKLGKLAKYYRVQEDK